MMLQLRWTVVGWRVGMKPPPHRAEHFRTRTLVLPMPSPIQPTRGYSYTYTSHTSTHMATPSYKKRHQIGM